MSNYLDSKGFLYLLAKLKGWVEDKGYTSNEGTITNITTKSGSYKAVNAEEGRVEINIPTNTSHLNNDSGFITSEDIEEIAQGYFKGTVTDNSQISRFPYKKGWYWVVGVEGEYVGQNCEVGDFIYCIKDFDSVYIIDDFEVVQGNLEPVQKEDIDHLFKNFN